MSSYSQVSEFEQVDSALSWLALLATLAGSIWSLLPEVMCSTDPRNTTNLDNDKACAVPPAVPQREAADVEHGGAPPAKSVAAERAPQKPPKMFFIDNVKLLLTFMVLLVHAMVSFNGQGAPVGIGNYPGTFQQITSYVNKLCQSFFMALFFMISGYFTPSSLARKGVRLFLKERFMRIGLPGVFYWMVIGPLLQLCINYTFDLCSEYRYNPAFGPAWFCIWLMWFNVGYTIVYSISSSSRL